MGIGCDRMGRNTRIGAQGLRLDPEGSQRDFSRWWRQVSDSSRP